MEVLITMFILEVVMLAILSVIVTGANFLMKMEQTTTAAQAIQKEIECIRNMPFDDITALDSNFSNEELTHLDSGQGFIYLDNAAGFDIKKLTVSVQWTYRGRLQKKDAVTMVTREGIDGK